tara:strand:- start:100 stop:231 length:132 start_codon:yes stop_codon:yes gene_type:complete
MYVNNSNTGEKLIEIKFEVFGSFNQNENKTTNFIKKNKGEIKR